MLQICADCTCPYSVGAPKCPHCSSVRFRWQGDEGGSVRLTEAGELIEESGTKSTKRTKGVRGEEGPELVDPPAGAVIERGTTA